MGTAIPQKLTPTGWVVDHDDRRSFILTYLILSVGLSVFVSLFWLVILVGIHFGLEMARSRRLQLQPALGHALWEIKLDIGLLLLAIAMAVYMELAFGILGLGAGARAGAAAARLGGRANLIRRAVRFFFLVLDDIVRVLGVVITARGIGESQRPSVVSEGTSPWRERWGWGDRIALGLLAAAFLLLALSPLLSGHSLREILDLVLAEFHPWPPPAEPPS